MAYTKQKSDFATNLVTTNERFMVAMNEFRNLVQYYNTTLQGENALGDAEEFQNGITGADLKGVLTSLSAVESFLITNYHYTNLNKIR